MRLLLLLLPLLAGCAAEAPPAQEFLAWGDMPYCRHVADTAGCARQEATVARLVRAMNRTGIPTAVFLGDTKASQEACDLSHTITRPAALFGAFDGAMVYTPGDNEWTDCERPNVARGGVGALASLARLREAFFPAPRSLGARPIALATQPGTPENARWQEGQALFATFNIPGEPPGQPAFPGDGPALAALNRANLAWAEAAFVEATRLRLPVLVLAFQADLWQPCLMEQNRGTPRCWELPKSGHHGTLRTDTPYPYRDFVAAIARLAAAFPGQLLLLHGDTHEWLEDHAPGDGQGGVIRNATRFMVPGEDDMRAVRVRIAPGAAQPFSFVEVKP